MKHQSEIEKLMSGYLTTAQVSEKLNITRQRVIQLIHAGRLPALRIGTDFFIRPDGLKLVKDRRPGRPKKTEPTTKKKATTKKSRKS